MYASFYSAKSHRSGRATLVMYTGLPDPPLTCQAQTPDGGQLFVIIADSGRRGLPQGGACGIFDGWEDPMTLAARCGRTSRWSLWTP
jgi:hypothetical protein